MNTETTIKTEENVKKESNSLMRKTKAQLVDIILRKDSVEKTLRNAINTYKETIDNQNNDIEYFSKRYDEINEDFKSICDDYATDKITFKKRNRFKNIIITILFILLILVLIIC